MTTANSLHELQAAPHFFANVIPEQTASFTHNVADAWSGDVLLLQSITAPDSHATFPAGLDETADFMNGPPDDTLLLRRKTMCNALQYHRLLGCLQYVSNMSDICVCCGLL